jgi:hypothetical protein
LPQSEDRERQKRKSANDETGALHAESFPGYRDAMRACG